MYEILLILGIVGFVCVVYFLWETNINLPTLHQFGIELSKDREFEKQKGLADSRTQFTTGLNVPKEQQVVINLEELPDQAMYSDELLKMIANKDSEVSVVWTEEAPQVKDPLELEKERLVYMTLFGS